MLLDAFDFRRRALRVSAVMMICSALVGTSCGHEGTARRPDALVPPRALVGVNLFPIIFADQFEVTTSPQLAGMHIGRIIVSLPRRGDGGAAGIENHGEIERFVRKALLKRGVDLVVGEVRAKVESSRNLQNRKEDLTEAEKLILLGKDSGADAILVFDEASTSKHTFDVGLVWNASSRSFDAHPTASGSVTPSCPAAFRLDVPGFTAKGRLVNSANATILAEFESQKIFYTDPEGLAAPVQVDQYYPQEMRARDTYTTYDGCSEKYNTYDYISSWQPIDVLCSNVQRSVAPHVPPADDSWKHIEGGVDAAVDKIVSNILKR
jgi:hypothetical protein